MRKTNLCQKCGSKDLSKERDARLQGREFLKIISCNKCNFVEFYIPEYEEKERKKKNASVFLWSMLIVGLVIPIGVVLLLVI